MMPDFNDAPRQGENFRRNRWGVRPEFWCETCSGLGAIALISHKGGMLRERYFWDWTCPTCHGQSWPKELRDEFSSNFAKTGVDVDFV